jgi:large subunit ribosomal protein L10
MRPEKPIIVEHIQNLLDESGNFLLVSYSGISVKKQEELKGLLKGQNAQFQVHKNKLIKKAAEGKTYSAISDLELTGGTAIVYGEGETSEWAKVVKKFAKDNEEVSFKGAFFEGELLDASKAAQVAELPSKDEARALVLSALMAGPQKLVGILNQVVSGVPSVIKNHCDKQNESE